MKLHHNVKLLTWFNFFTDFRPYGPIAILYFARVSGSYALGLGVFSIEMLATSILEVPTGIISDMMGRRKTIMVGAMAAVAALVCYAIGTHFWVLVVGSVFAGLARALYSGNNSALLHDSLKEQQQEHIYAEQSGKTGSMFQFALAVSALAGGVIAYFSFPAVMWLSVIPQVICVIISFRIREPNVYDRDDETNIYSHVKDALVRFKENSKLRSLSIASILEYGIGETIYQFSVAFIALLWPVWAIGISKMFSNLFAAIGMRVSGQVTKKLGFFKSILVANIYSRGMGLVAVIFPSVVSPVLMASASFPYGIDAIAKDAVFQKESTDRQRATMGSLNSLGGSLFFAVFAFGFGMVADKLAPQHALIIGQVALAFVIIIYWRLFKRHEI